MTAADQSGSVALLGIAERAILREIIGVEAEALVYLRR